MPGHSCVESEIAKHKKLINHRYIDIDCDELHIYEYMGGLAPIERRRGACMGHGRRVCGDVSRDHTSTQIFVL